MVCLAPQLFLPLYLCANVGPPALLAATSQGPPATALSRESSPPSCPSPPLLLGWMNVSSLTLWLSDFHTVRFSVSSGCFLFLNCCCPSFGSARRHSVSTYASILSRSLDVLNALGYMPRTGIAGSCGSSVFNLLRNYRLFSRGAVPFYNHTCNI